MPEPRCGHHLTFLCQVPAEYVNRYLHTLKLLRWFEYYNFGIS